MLVEDIVIPEVPIPLRTITAHKMRVAAIKRAKAKIRDAQRRKTRLVSAVKKKSPSRP
jgi:hypothetical protein